MSAAEKLLAAFEGSSVAHGRTIVGRTGRNGKTEADSRVIREPLTVEKTQVHLDGKVGAGAIPINYENMCKFGALDIDTYDLDIKSLNEKVQRMKMPLILCRSKSGGAHLFLFLKEWEPAVLIREYLTEMSVALGHSGCEIFPKQDKILSERGDVGNFINLPYYGGDITTRYALDAKGESLDVDGFLKLAEKKRTTVAALDRLKFGGDRKYFTDGPYCLETIASQGLVTSNRNIFMFNVGVYCRLKWPDEWKARMEEFNRVLCSPALEAAEVVNIQKSLDKNDKYFYQCDQCPLKDFCDKNICKSRQHGIGSAVVDMPEVGGLTILLSEPRIYFMDVNGQRLQLSVEQLQNQMLWQRACMEQLSIMPPTIKPREWQQMINDLMQKSVMVEVPEELTISGQFKELLRVYCTSRIRATAPEELEMGKPWTTDDGRTMFTMSGLEQFLKHRGFTSYKRAEIQEQIKKLNEDATHGHSYHGHQAIRRADGGRSTVRVWWVPAFKNEEVKLEVEEKTYDIPF